MRRLSPEEAALWQRVTGTVRRGNPAQRIAIEPMRHAREGGISTPGRAHGTVVQTMAPRLRGGDGRAERSSTPSANTLDGGWDKRIAGGRIVPERTIDLHGLNLEGAHARLEHGLAVAVRDGVRVILLVTGRPPRPGASRIDLPLRGVIRASVGDWLAGSRHAGAVAAIRNAHPRHGGAGALYIVLRRPRPVR